MGDGGWDPSPRKLKPASAIIAVAIPRVAKTKTGEIHWGRIFPQIIRKFLHPMARAASTYFWL